MRQLINIFIIARPFPCFKCVTLHTVKIYETFLPRGDAAIYQQFKYSTSFEFFWPTRKRMSFSFLVDTRCVLGIFIKQKRIAPTFFERELVNDSVCSLGTHFVFELSVRFCQDGIMVKNVLIFFPRKLCFFFLDNDYYYIEF